MCWALTLAYHVLEPFMLTRAGCVGEVNLTTESMTAMQGQIKVLYITFLSNELPHEKPTKWHVRPAKTQIRPVWSESSLPTWRNLGSLVTHWAHSKDWSDWMNAQADLSLRWAHMPFCWFCQEAAQMSISSLWIDSLLSEKLRARNIASLRAIFNLWS